jgi:hypothetical protein
MYFQYNISTERASTIFPRGAGMYCTWEIGFSVGHGFIKSLGRAASAIYRCQWFQFSSIAAFFLAVILLELRFWTCSV